SPDGQDRLAVVPAGEESLGAVEVLAEHVRDPELAGLTADAHLLLARRHTLPAVVDLQHRLLLLSRERTRVTRRAHRAPEDGVLPRRAEPPAGVVAPRYVIGTRRPRPPRASRSGASPCATS